MASLGTVEDLARAIAAQTRNVRALARHGWSVPMRATPAQLPTNLGRRTAEGIDTWFVEFYSADEGAMFNEVRRATLANRDLERWHGVLHQAYEAYDREHFLVAVPALLAVSEGVVAAVGGVLDRKAKVDAVLDARGKREPENSFRRLVVASLREVVGAVFASQHFGGDPPAFMNRHWILHGREMQQVTQADCLRVVQLVDGLATFIGEVPNESNQYVHLTRGYAARS